MDRFKIKEMRDQIEAAGFFVEEIDDGVIVVSHLMDKYSKKFLVYEHINCPECGSYMSFDNISKDMMCLNKDCMFEEQILTPPEIKEDTDEKMIYKQIVLACKASDYMYLNTVLEEIQELVDNWCEIILLEDEIHPESTLGIE